MHGEDEEDHDDTPVPHNLEARAGERVWDNLAPAVSAPNICVPALYENTCKTITQSKKKLHLMLSAFNFLPNLISYVYNYMLIFDIASLLLWCSELVSRILLVPSPQSSPPVCPSASLFTPSCSKGIGVPVIRAL